MLDDQSPAKSAKYNIQKDREYERVKQRLEEEFAVLDLNQDGKITLEEVETFLKEKAGDQEIS
jgi:Ca2+-binding EF-hand superfamily protein